FFFKKNFFRIIKKNKNLFLLIILAQLLFCSAFVTTQLVYQPKMFESSQAIYEYLGKADKGEMPEASFLGKDPLLISRKLKEAANYLRTNLILTVLSFIILNGLVWALTHRLFRKMKSREFFYTYLNFGIVSLIFFAAMALTSQAIIKASLKTLITEGRIIPMYVVLVITLLVLAHFLLATLAMLKHDRILQTIKKGLVLGLTKIHKMLLMYLIMIIIYIPVFFLIYLAFNAHFVVLGFALLLLPLATVINRIFFIGSMKELEKSA
ncbi:hypothetical protein D6745_00125, partial [Candidatus Woesearchaeota archaeon]